MKANEDKKNILFRVNSSSFIGIGHLMRDLVLAQKYKAKGYNIIFATQDLEGNINHKILEDSYKLKILKSNDKKELINLIKKLNIDLLVIDSYDIDYKFEKYIKSKTNVKILSFDDTYKKHYCDILLNHNINANKKRYKKLVPRHCELKCGSKYTLLRDEFIKEKKKIKKKSLKKDSKIRVFIAMGGADHSNINIKILNVLKGLTKIEVNLVTTNANKNLEDLKKYCKDKKWVKLHINSNKIAKLMVQSDFAIVTPSVTVNEVYFLNLPFIAIKTADNQNDMYKYLKNRQYIVLNKFDEDILKKETYKLIKKVF
ncbi:MAG: UDP-2,4-diacetamido-2,4,6-trideoxy-beta-L-altropyranose hydrolase [Arcobacter sp.]|nr:MAG: UDP-2,4-diacetamido-2,4,6-trideoxy-beta-L-altropyranose hydrolase [Arcobacter sp.]